MTPASSASGKAAARDTSAKRSLITPVMARRAPRRLTGRRGADEGLARARAAFDVDDHARLVAACAHYGYELVAPIGDGGMGRVWLARGVDARAAAPIVAIKAMLPKVADDAEFRAMFVDEGRIASRVESPHVVRILGLHEQDGVLFQVLEYVDGESLLDLHVAAARAGQRLPLAVVVRAIADACDGLYAAHQACGEDGRPLNVVHRDVSPANVLVAAAGEAKLVDFGIAKARARVAQSTLGFAMKGRVLYVSPEYALGHALDQRADTWSMGATLYFLLCGRAPYSASNDAATIFKLTSGEPVPPLPPPIPAPIAAIAYRALARDPADRFATAAEMRDALASALVHTGSPAPSRDVLRRFIAEHESPETRERRELIQAPEGARTTDAPVATTAETPAPARKRALVVGIAVAAAVFLSALQCAWLFAGSPPEAHAANAMAITRDANAKSLAVEAPDTFMLELPATPAPPRAPMTRVSAPHPVEAHPSESHTTAAPRPSRRHYGF